MDYSSLFGSVAEARIGVQVCVPLDTLDGAGKLALKRLLGCAARE
jgi:hypothetical protein